MFRNLNMRLLVALTLSASLVSGLSPFVLDLHVDEEHTQARRQLLARDGPITANTYPYQQVFYYAPVQVGTPAQTVQLGIATNTGDTVMPASFLCGTNLTCTWGSYNANGSTTSKPRGDTFSINYADGSSSSGMVYTDAFGIGGQNIANMTLCISNKSSSAKPIMGLGYNTLHATAQPYINLPYLVQRQGSSNIAGYSLYFNHSDTTYAGRLAFGALDTNKFYGKLETLQFQTTDQASYTLTNIQLSGVSFFDGFNNLTLLGATTVVKPDPGATSIRLPPQIVNTIASVLKLTVDGSGNYIYQLGTADNATVNFIFGAATIRIPVGDLIFTNNGTHAVLALLVTTATQTYPTLGVPFFKNAYTVYDLTHNQLSVAPLRYESSPNNYTMIGALGAAGTIGYVAPVVNNTTPDSGSNDGGLSTGAKAGIGAGVGGAALIGILLAVFLLMRRRKRKAAATTTAAAPVQPTAPHTAPAPIYNEKNQHASVQQQPTGYMTPNHHSHSYSHEVAGDSVRHSQPTYYDQSRTSAAYQPSEVYGSEPRSPMSEGGTVRDSIMTSTARESTRAPSTVYDPPGSPNANQFKRKPIPPQELA